MNHNAFIIIIIIIIIIIFSSQMIDVIEHTEFLLLS
jgi:hypothetical protein